MENLVIKYFFSLFCCLSLLTSCNDDSNENTPSPLQMLSSTPAEGTKVDPGNIEVGFEFDQPVLISDSSKITFNGERISNIYTVARYLKAKVPVLAGSTNVFEIEEGALSVFRSEKVNEQSYTLRFSATSTASGKSTEAERLLQYLKDINGVKMLTAASASIDWNQKEAMWVHKHTGKYPAINGFDYLHAVNSTPGGWIDYSDITPVKTWADEGGIVAAMWHWEQATNDQTGYTCTPGSAGDETGFRPSDIFNPESDGYKKMIEDIDRIAGWMKPIAELRIPVLWRPLHEAQGNWTENSDGEAWQKAWFWWGIDGPDAFIELWRVMYDRMVNHHGLTNLIWVFTIGDSVLWYPGSDYVDIVGGDFYNNMEVAHYSSWYNTMSANFPDKLIALTECGGVPKISEQWNAGARWSYFMPWWDSERTNDPSSPEFDSPLHSHFNIEYWNDALNCDFIVTRDQLPSFRNN